MGHLGRKFENESSCPKMGHLGRNFKNGAFRSKNFKIGHLGQKWVTPIYVEKFQKGDTNINIIHQYSNIIIKYQYLLHNENDDGRRESMKYRARLKSWQEKPHVCGTEPGLCQDSFRFCSRLSTFFIFFFILLLLLLLQSFSAVVW